MADRKISDLTALTTPASGDYVPIVDISESAAASKNKRVTIQSLFQGIPVNVGIGTSSPQSRLDLGAGSTGATQISWHDSSTTSYGNIWQSFNGARTTIANGLKGSTTVVNGFESSTSNLWGRAATELDYGVIKFYTDAASTVAYGTAITPSERMRIDSSGRVGIGTSSPTRQLDVRSTAFFDSNGDGTGTNPSIAIGSTSVGLSYVGGGHLSFTTGSAETARIDSSGRLLVGTSSARANFYNSTNSARFQIEGSGGNDNYALSIVSNFAGNTNGAQVILAKSRGSNVGDNTLPVSGDTIGQINFQGADGTEFVPAASIAGEVDGTPGANDMPGRLVFSVTADGAASPTEALRISNDRSITVSDGGHVVLGTTTGTKIGTATTQKIGFYNATPVVQPAAVANITTTATAGSLPTANGAVTIANAATPTVAELLEYCVELEAKLEDLLGKLRTVGIIAT